MKNRFYLTLLTLLIATTALAAPDSMRCGTRLISEGDTKAEVLIKCGEPLLKETIAIKERSKEIQLKSVAAFMANRDHANASRHKHIENDHHVKGSDGHSGEIHLETNVSLPIDRWTYDLGKGRFLRILIFEGGTLVHIAAGDRS